MKNFSTEAKVGLLAIISIVMAVYFISRVDDIPTGAEKGRGYKLHAQLKDVSGIYLKTPVEIAGVKVGYVEGITLVDDENHEKVARLTLQIQGGVLLPFDSTVVAQPKGLLGDKVLTIVPGQAGVSDQTHKKSGDPINTGPPPPDIDEIIRRADEMTRDIKDVTSTMRDALGSEEAEERLTSILTNIERFSSNMAQVSQSNREALDQVVENMRVLSEQLRLVVERTNTGVDNSFETLEGAADKLDATLASVSSISKKIDDGEGTIGQLINDSDTAEGLESAIEGVNDIVERIDRIRINVDYHLEALAFGPSFGFEPDRGLKNYLGVRVQPHPDYFYNLEFVDDPRGLVTEKETTFTETDPLGGPDIVRTVKERRVEDEFKVTFQFARKLSNATFRLGIKESSGGVGVDYWLAKDKFKLSLDAFEFSRDNENPHLKFLATYDFHRHIFVVAGADDFVSRLDNRSFFLGAGLTFNDDDLKFVLSALPVP